MSKVLLIINHVVKFLREKSNVKYLINIKVANL
jgi:hypothetical protein